MGYRFALVSTDGDSVNRRRFPSGALHVDEERAGHGVGA